MPEEIRIEIIALVRQGLSLRAIARIISERFHRQGITHSTISRVYNNYLRNHDVQNHWNDIGRPRILTPADERQIVRYAQTNRQATVQQIINDLRLEVSRNTVNRVLIRNGL